MKSNSLIFFRQIGEFLPGAGAELKASFVPLTYVRDKELQDPRAALDALTYPAKCSIGKERKT